MNLPPKILYWLLDSICPTDRQDLKGDFIELYHYRCNNSGRLKANAGFIRDIITTIPLTWIIKKKKTNQRIPFMLLAHMKTARRTLVRNKMYSFINVTGLSVGLSACLLITLFVRDELSFDKQIKDYERIYRISGNYQQGVDSRVSSAATTFLLQPLLQEKLSGVEASSRVEFRFDEITAENKDYLQSDIAYADSTFFDIFSLPFIHGNPASALDDPTQVVVDRETALKFFGEENALGKSITMKDKHFTISGVIENMPANMHFFAHVIFPISGIKQWYADWVFSNISGRSVYTYVKVMKDHDVGKLENQCNGILKANWPQKDGVPQLILQPITSIHLGPAMQGETKPNGTETDVYIFCITAIIILLLACINYINLSMAAALPRSKEAGIKRVLGSTVRMMLGQFQTESFLVLVISGLIASCIMDVYADA